jgi:flagellar hook protein FlgE
MGAISDNISNINTVGYKQTDVNFQTLVTKQVSSTEYSPGGVQSKPRADITSQGVLQATTSSTDISISGQGFFVVNSEATPLQSGGGEFAYTRAGSFTVDQNGYLQNASGFYLQGWPLQAWDSTATASHQTINGTQYMAAYKNSNGSYTYINTGVVDPTNMQPLNLDNIAGTAAATTNISLGANLPSGATVGQTETTNLLDYDSLGNSHNLLLTWTKTAQNQWGLGVTPPEGATQVSLNDGFGTSTGNVYAASGRLDFSKVPTADTVNTASFSIGKNSALVATTLPKSTFTMSFGSSAANSPSTFAFVTGSGTNGSPANTFYADPSTVSSTDAPAYAAIVANNMQIAYLTQYAGGPAQAAYAAPAAAGTLSITVSGTTTPVTYAAGATISTIIANINTASATTGVHAWNNGGTINFYSTNGTPGQSVTATVTDSGANTALLPTGGSVTGTGLSYVSQVAGVGSIVFNQFDSTTATTVSNLQNIVTSTGTYALEQAYNTNSSGNTFTVPVVSTQVYSGTNAFTNTPGVSPAIIFNGDGTPKDVMVSRMLINWANGSQNQTATTGSATTSPLVNLFLGDTNVSDGMTQLSGSYSLTYQTQNGAKFGNFQSLSVSSDGIVTAQFDNGVTRPIFQIPTTTFVNPDGMSSLTGNVFIGTDTSGLPTLRTPGSAGSGTVNEASLEASTVDLGSQFTTMIVTQRAYSAAAKIITTANEMLDDLLNIKR